MITDRRKGAHDGESSRNSSVPTTGAQTKFTTRRSSKETHERKVGKKKDGEQRCQ